MKKKNERVKIIICWTLILGMILSVIISSGIFAAASSAECVSIKVNIDQNNKNVLLKWSPVKGASSYKVYRFEKPTDIDTITKTKGTNLTDSDIRRNVLYSYHVHAYDKSGNSIGYGYAEIIKIKTPPFSISQPAADRVQIKWIKDEYASRYKLEYSEGASFNNKIAKKQYFGKNVTSAMISGLKRGTQYTFRLSTEQKHKEWKYFLPEDTFNPNEYSSSARYYKTVNYS